ncbi:MAG: NAD(P)/FAD-dependent oxidoreductase [Chloroflexota bacterium]
MIYDSVIIGGGPAGLSAALVLGRARRNVILFDDNKPRNAVTQESHGYLTRDGITPTEFRQISHAEITNYPSVEIRPVRVSSVQKHSDLFEIVLEDSKSFQARSVILATGLKEKLPTVPHIHDFYGKSLFSCPYCDGWERQDKPLILISESEHAFHMAKTVWNWSHDLTVCTNGHQPLTKDQLETLQQKGIQIISDRITNLVGKGGHLEKVIFETQGEKDFETGFVTTQWFQASSFGSELGCEVNAQNLMVVDPLGRTTVPGVYAAGESLGFPSQLIIAAAEGSRAAAGVNMDLIEKEFAV